MDQEPEFTSETPFEQKSVLQSPRLRLDSAFFPNAHNFSIIGGQFKSIRNMYHEEPPEPLDFPSIPMGHLRLDDMQLASKSGVVHRRAGRGFVRRIYVAMINGYHSKMTAAIYDGENAEDEWREAISRHSHLRHPNIMQLFGTAKAYGIHAAIFHDELVHAQQLLFDKYQSPISTVYCRLFLNEEFEDAAQYVKLVSGASPSPRDCTLWIRPLSGGLCVDLMPSHKDSSFWIELPSVHRTASRGSLLEPNHESEIKSSMTLEAYHYSCFFHLSRYRWLPNSTHSAVRLGSVNCLSGSGYDGSIERAFIPGCQVSHDRWNIGGTGLILDNGWTRIPSAEVRDVYYIAMWLDGSEDEEWLSQANHIFKCLNVTSNHENYIFAHTVNFWVELFGPNDNLLPGYLFLCPLSDLQSDDPLRFLYPDCPAYWSLDPSGIERLCADEAEHLGFSSLQFEMTTGGIYWDTSVYEGLRQFHEGKGFDPYSQEVAKHLGHSLYQLSNVLDCAHVEEVCEEDGLSADERSLPDSQSTADRWPADPSHPAVLRDVSVSKCETDLTPFDHDTLFGIHWGP
ncbi:hypothetical protein B0H11DRAFT_2192922 [Mycena galericulata]|nr:hypothetical protein B0H11DRAFT_2192922 [Mycena galericulata]